jgi:diaminopimelate decarboxylase
MTSALLPGHPHIARRGNDLTIEGVALSGLARAHGTPLFVYSKASMLAALAAYQRGFAGRKALICYAMKANSSLAILQVLRTPAAASTSCPAASWSACWRLAARPPA